MRTPITFLSKRGVYPFGRGLGSLLYCVMGKRRKIARLNLDIAFGDSKTDAEKERIIKESVIQQIVTLVQFLWLHPDPQKRANALQEGEVEGLDVLRECRRRGQGVLFLCAHYGNWEILGIGHGGRDLGKLVSIARRLENPYLESYVSRMRTFSGNQILHRDDNPIKMVRVLRNNDSLAIVMDQNAGDWGTFVDFFGKPASTTKAPALLSYQHGSPILPVFSFPTGKGTYRIVIGPELRLKKCGSKEQTLVKWTSACAQHLEWVIRQHPEPWMWIHRRWKSRPEGEPRGSVYGLGK